MSGTASETSPSSSYSSSSPSGGMTIDIRPMIEDVSQVMTKHITSILTGVIGEYTIYKETHDTIMGLPCVRKLQDRIMELEQIGGGGAGGGGETIPRTTTASMNSREDEIAQLQSAIVDLNRYIHALESKVDMNAVASAGARGGNGNRQDEESVKLEIHENDDEDQETEEDEGQDVPCVVSSTHKNVIITSDAIEEDEAEEEEAEEEEAEEEEADDKEDEESEAEAEEEEAEEEEAEGEEADAEEEEADAEGEEAEAEEAEAEGEEAEAEEDEAEAEPEDTEADAEAEEAEAEEAEIEVSEVKIKGKTYFTTDAQNGIIYACVDDDVGDEVGVFKNGVAVFNKGKK